MTGSQFHDMEPQEDGARGLPMSKCLLAKKREDRFGRTVLTAACVAITGAIATLSGSLDATAGIKQKTTYQYYSVTGRSALDLVRSMYAKGPRHWGNSYILAQIRMTRRLQFNVQQTRRGCRFSKMDQIFNFRIILPRMRGERRLDRRTRRSWRSFVRYLDNHEKVHRRIWLNCAKRTEARIRRLPRNRSCAQLQQSARQIFASIDRTCARQQADYDRRDYKTTNRQPLMRQAIASIRRSRGRAVAANRRGTRRNTPNRRTRAATTRCCD